MQETDKLRVTRPAEIWEVRLHRQPDLASGDGTSRAGYGLQVLSRVLSYAVDPLGRIASNPCEGIKHLYSADHSEVIWADDDIALIKKTCSLEIAHAIDLAAHTGLRLGDLLCLSWSHVGEHEINFATQQEPAA